MPDEITLIIADDHPIFRQGLKQLIELHPGFRVVAEADDGKTALDVIKVHAPLVALLDLNMPGLDGFEVARQIQQLGLPVKSLSSQCIKMNCTLTRLSNSASRGTSSKTSAVTEVIDCIQTVIKGRDYFSPALTSFLLKRSRRLPPGQPAWTS